MKSLTSGDLDTIYPKPNARVIAKAQPHLDKHAQRFISMSPFCVIATSGSDGSVDASPRGGNPGFVLVEGTTILYMPDRGGNNRLDNFRNIVEGSGQIHLLFLVPGIDEMLRINGKASVVNDADLLAHMLEFGKPPRAALRIDVIENYFHCGKAAMRSKIWSDQTRVKRSEFPSIGEINFDRTSLGEAESQSAIEAAYKDQL
jgi:PPOX class probable FMN-dependent enzyme